MYNLDKSPFDSQLFNCNVYKLHIDKEIAHENEIRKLFVDKNIDILFCFSKFFNKNISVLQNLGFSFVSIRSTYQLHLKSYIFAKKSKKLPPAIKIIQYSSTRWKILTEDISRLAEVLLPQSRYSKDRAIPKKIGRKIFEAWIQNSLYHQFADDAFIAVKDKRLIGVISFKVKQKVAYLDLVCVLPEFQSRGIGTLLLHQVINHLKEKNVATLVTISQAENIPANIFYQKNQFIIQDIEMVYHKHFRSL